MQHVIAVRSNARISNIGTLKAIYYASFHSVIKYGRIVWGNCWNIGKTFISQKKNFHNYDRCKTQSLLYTVAQKERIFFPNNCNFFYFQYKKIMLTQKQPVINAVLITFIDYSVTET